MKTTNLKYIAYALSALMLMQSCTVYQKNLSTIDEALYSEKRKKLVTTDDEVYKVKRITRESDTIIAIARAEVISGKMSTYVTQVYSEDSKAELRIPSEYIKGFYLKNQSTSTAITLVSIALPIIIIGALVLQGLNSLWG